MTRDTNELPVGLTMALAQNTDAMQTFSNLSEKERLEIIERAKSAKSYADMELLLQAVSNGSLK